ncbi:hypothetical protein Pa4123_81800 [Phytohabitans aurantiacus]|uniref:Peptidase S1 domain-containing protein n=2 Tax=Phytohabitans aurantiacus TaxID=3016789 RepID=A0ABQ5R9S8_9ACTN|nr:hypothetical protein Pa4123_81800 [Phytohabitans aurantiacus]
MVAVLATSVLSGAGGADAAPPEKGSHPLDAATMAMPEFEDLVQGYRAANPTITVAEIRQRAAGQGRRTELVERLSSEHADTFGGTWYDLATDTQHLQATTAQAATEYATAAAAAGVRANTQVVRHTLGRLVEEFTAIRYGRHPKLGPQAATDARLDVPGNAVVVEVDDPGSMPVPGGVVRYGQRRAAPAAEPTACIDRWNCGGPIRAGINLRHRSDASDVNVCSLGATATSADGTSRWVITAGHCAGTAVHTSCSVASQCWRHGEQDIGPMRETACPQDFPVACQHDYPFIDVGRIRIDSTYWKSFSQGWMFNGIDPTTAVEIDGAITTFTQLSNMVGQSLCMNAMWSNEGANCGPLFSAASGTFAMPEVWSVRACRGDSGGLWYRPSGGIRTAVGIQSSATLPYPGGPDCRRATGSSWFGAFPDINAFWDAYAGAGVLRIDTR